MVLNDEARVNEVAEVEAAVDVAVSDVMLAMIFPNAATAAADGGADFPGLLSRLLLLLLWSFLRG